MRFISTILFLACWLNVANARHHQPIHDFSKDTIMLNQVVITGTRTPKALAKSPITTRVITASDIKRTDATDIQDLLQQEMPGVEFSYAMNQQTHLNIAGFGGQSILFLVDGERLAGETMDDVDFSRLVMTDVECIEIVKGAASALYGSNAGGGVVNIITRKASKPWNVRANSRWAKHNGQRYSMEVGTKQQRFGNNFSATYNRIDNFGVESDDDAVTRVFSEVYGNKTLNLRDKLTVDVLDNLHLTGRLGYTFREQARTPNEPDRYRDYSAGIKGEWDITQADHMELSYAFDQYDKSVYQQLHHLDIRTYSNVQNSLRALYSHETGQGDVLSVGSDVMRDYLLNNRLTDGKRSQVTFDVFAQYDWNLNSQWELVGAMRYDYFSDGAISRLTPKLSVRYQPQCNLNLRMGYGMGFRAPTLKEKYSEFDMAGIWIVEGREDLRSEVSHNLTASAEYTKGRYNFMAIGYYNNVRHKISTGIPYYSAGAGSQLRLPYNNLDHYSVYGAELSASRRWDHVTAKLGYAYTCENLQKNNEGNTVNNQYLPARPHSLTWSLTYDKNLTDNYAVSATLSGRYLSAVDNQEYLDYYDISKGTATVSYPAYSLWKLSVVQRLWKRASVSVAVDNLLNYRPKYYYLNAPITDGANLMIGLSLDLD